MTTSNGLTDTSPVSAGGDPARAWAYEHYGFADEAPAVPPAVTPSASAAPPVPARGFARRGRRMVVAGALLGLLLAGGAGGAALAAADAGAGVGAWFDGDRNGGPGGGGRGGGR